MKVLLLNGSAKRNGCTNEALSEIASVLESEGISAEIFHIGTEAICDCTGCGACAHLGKCIYGDDGVNEFTARAADADGFVFGTPVYYAHPSGRILSFLDRAFYSSRKVFAHKPGAAIASARRAGTTASVDVLNKYFTIAEMPVVSSSYWNMVHGSTPDDVRRDLEGLQTMRNLAHNMAWLLRCIEAGKEKSGISVPENDRSNRTDFIS